MPWRENQWTRAAPVSAASQRTRDAEEEPLEEEEKDDPRAAGAHRPHRPDLPRPLEDRHESRVEDAEGGDDREHEVQDPAHEPGDDHAADEGTAHLLPRVGPGGRPAALEGFVDRGRHRRGRRWSSFWRKTRTPAASPASSSSWTAPRLAKQEPHS